MEFVLILFPLKVMLPLDAHFQKSSVIHSVNGCVKKDNSSILKPSRARIVTTPVSHALNLTSLTVSPARADFI